MKRFLLKHTLALAAILSLLCGWLVVEATAANRYINNVASSAFFIDDTMTSSGAYDWSTYYGYRIVVSDNAGKQAVGYVGSKGSGVSTFGSELLVNGDCSADNFTKGPGATYDAANQEYDINSSYIYQSVKTIGVLYKFGFTVKNYNSGYAFASTSNGAQTGSALTANGSLVGYGTGMYNDRVYFFGDGFVGSYDDMTFKKVLTPGSTGCSIYSSQTMTTNSWESVETDFDPNWIISYTLSRPQPAAVFVKTTGASPFFIDTSRTLTEFAGYYPDRQIVFESGVTEARFRIKSMGSGASSFTMPGVHGAYLDSEQIGSGFDGYNITSWRIEDAVGPRDRARRNSKIVARSDSLSVLPETTTYIYRVQADGGTVVSQSDVNASVWNAQLNGYWSSVTGWWCAQFGVKKDSGTAGVTTWYDLSPNNYDVTQTTRANQPVWYSDVQNGKAGVTFDGTNDYLSSSVGLGFEWNTPFSLVAAIRPTDVGTLGGIASKQLKAGTFAGWWTIHSAAGLHDSSFINTGPGNKFIEVADTVALVNSANYLLRVNYLGTGTAAGVSMYRNGTLETETVVRDTLAASSISTTAPFCISGREDGTYPFKGPIFEIAIITGNASTALESFLNSRWVVY
jgi:hypothetical protein